MPYLEDDLLISRCPHCNVDNPNLTMTRRFETRNYKGDNERCWATYACRRCGGVTTAWSYQLGSKIEEMFPCAISIDASIPGKAKDYLNQAIDSLHAPAGSIMLSASSVDAMLKEKGYKEGTLNTRINQAAEKHLITKDMAVWAHEVRLDANDQRHADESATMPTEKDAKTTVDFVLALAQFLFVMPSKIQRGIEEAKS